MTSLRDPVPSISSGVPKDARELIWNVFFAARNRGVTLSYHFPWIDESQIVRCIKLQIPDGSSFKCVATLIIKLDELSGVGRIGLIGLVCVHVDYRGRRFSTRLLESALEVARQEGLRCLVLWTSHPSVYEKVGFSTDSMDVFGSISRGESLQESALRSEESITVTISECRDGGVPAFASSVIRYSSEDASLYVCQSGERRSVVQWTGSVPAVMKLISLVLPDEWQLNADQFDPLIDALRRQGYRATLKPSTHRMVRVLSDSGASNLPYIGLLQRI